MDDLATELFQNWKQTQVNKERCLLKSKKNNQNKKRNIKIKESNNELQSIINVKKSTNLQPLSDDFLQALDNDKSSLNQTKKDASKKKKKKKVKLTSAIMDTADFIPLETKANSTDFKVVRLDKDNHSRSTVDNAMEFLNRRLYGRHIKRVPSKSLFDGEDKIKAKRSLCVKS